MNHLFTYKHIIYDSIINLIKKPVEVYLFVKILESPDIIS